MAIPEAWFRDARTAANHQHAHAHRHGPPPRIDLPGIPQHVVQRGNNRLPCFLDDGDRLRYLQLLRESLATTYCGLHAYHASNPTASGRGP
jgi:hypothetical protein